eukprot:3588589-Rhodomonas_salina.14
MSDPDRALQTCRLAGYLESEPVVSLTVQRHSVDLQTPSILAPDIACHIQRQLPVTAISTNPMAALPSEYRAGDVDPTRLVAAQSKSDTKGHRILANA